MRMFLGIVLGVLGVAAIITMFTAMGAGVTVFWKAAHVVAGLVLIVAAIPMIRDSSRMHDTNTATYTNPRM